jgi:hypothetical protein
MSANRTRNVRTISDRARSPNVNGWSDFRQTRKAYKTSRNSVIQQKRRNLYERWKVVFTVPSWRYEKIIAS